jgi:thiamine biosynthesis lipoprotein
MTCARVRGCAPRLFVLAATLALGAPEVARAATAYVGEPVMGTVLDITVVADEPERARELARASITVARHWEDVLTTWRADGELEQLNASAGRGPHPIGSDLSAALERMLALWRATGGAFDPAVGATVEALRRGNTNGRETPETGAVRLGDVLELTSGAAALTARARLDAGGIGKGIALDAIAAYLGAHGARAWFLDFGGSSQLAHGRPENATAWNVLVAGSAPGTVAGVVGLEAGSLSTSRTVAPSDPAGAIVDPSTREAVTTPRLVSVLAVDATTADAWSTALVVLGRAGLQLAEAAGIGALLEDTAGTTMTRDFPLQQVRGSR